MNYLRVAFIFILVISPLAYSGEYKEVSWDDLMPKGWMPSAPQELEFFEDEAFDNGALGSQLEALPKTEVAPVVQSLDEQKLKLPGYIIPIKYNAGSVSEFLLVPYVGACIHTPPPPENQIVYVSLKKPMATNDMWAPVWVSGVMKVKLSMTELATAGYHMTEAVTKAYE